MITPWNNLNLLGTKTIKTSPTRWLDVWEGPHPTHAGALLKPEKGRSVGSPEIVSLHVHDDEHVLIGYGDWNVNDGSTALVTFNPKTGLSESHGIYPTEAFHTFKTIDGITYALFIDGIGFWEEMQPYATYPKQDITLGKIDAIHIFDIAKYDNKLWVSGSAHDGTGTGVATVWWSEDKGATWIKTTPSGVSGDWERVYRIGVVEEKLYARLNSTSWSSDGDWYVWNNSSWEKSTYPGPDPIPSTNRPDFLIPPRSTYTKTNTHWVLGTQYGELYTKEIK